MPSLLYTGVTRGKKVVVIVQAEEGHRDRRPQRVRATAMVEAAGVADEKSLSFVSAFRALRLLKAELAR